MLHQATQAWHKAGWVHGDIKPANAGVVPGTGAATLLDAGLATPVDLPARRKAGDSRKYHRGGTPGYQAPEVAAKRVKALTQACDVYSLGMTARKVRPSFSHVLRLRLRWVGVVRCSQRTSRLVCV